MGIKVITFNDSFVRRAAYIGSPPPNNVEPNQNQYQQAVCNQSVEQRSVLDCFANTVVENCGRKLYSVIVLKYCVNTANPNTVFNIVNHPTKQYAKQEKLCDDCATQELKTV